MASTTSGRVLYRSPDALQNLRVKVSLTRVSGPRADRAAELEARLAQERGEAQQQQQVEAQRQQAVDGTAPSIFKDDVPQPDYASDRAAAAQAAAAAATAFAPPALSAVLPSAADEIVDGGDDVGTTSAAPGTYVPQIGGRRARQSSLVRGDVSAALPPSSSTFDPYGTPSEAPAAQTEPGPVTESTQNAPPLRGQAENDVHFDRVVAWQEKIFSVAEATRRMGNVAGAETELDRKYDAMVHENNLQGETIYTYVSADRFADDLDAEKTVTTSATERVNGLFRAVFGSPAARVFAANAFGKDATRLRTEIARGGRKRGNGPVTFVICADCGPLELPADHPAMRDRETTSDKSGIQHEGEEVLMTIEAFPDGSISLSPDFNGDKEEDVYRIERRDGSVWEYSVRNASTREDTNLEKRQKDIAPTASMRALQLARRRRAGPGAFVPSPPDAAERLVFLGEIVSGRGFEHDNLYCEWALEYDTEVWKLEHDPEELLPNTAGVTQISKTTTYPSTGDGEGDGFFSADRRVAHWSAPIELCFVAKRFPTPREYPIVFFQVSSYDKWDRYRPEGYGSLSLCPKVIPGSDESKTNAKLFSNQTSNPERVIKTWRAGGSICDRIATHYVGGAPEIGNLSYVVTPRGSEGVFTEKVHSRLGFTADASGEIKVRAHVFTQRPKQLSAGAKKGVSALKGMFSKKGGLGAMLGKAGATSPGRQPNQQPIMDVDDDVENAAPDTSSSVKEEEEVEDVVARARARIAEARAQGRLDPDASARATMLARGPPGAHASAPTTRNVPMADASNTRASGEKSEGY